mgnify:CR=1 FL=1
MSNPIHENSRTISYFILIDEIIDNSFYVLTCTMPRYIHMYVSKISMYLKYLINEASLVKKSPLPCSFNKVKSASKSLRSIIKAAHLLDT